jgi:DNA polymerase-1
MKKLYLVDVSSFFFRAFFAIPPLSNKEGKPTNALYGFMNMIIKLLREIKPDYIAFCFDRKEKSFRYDKFPEYKANRSEMPEELKPQVPYLKKITEQLGIPHFDKIGFEADDVISSLSKFGRENHLEVVIVSGDKDFAQLVEPFVIMYDTMKDKKYDVQGVKEKWGVRPDQMVDYLAIIGDSSDNIPGIKGIGPKGAEKLLAEFNSLDGIYNNLELISSKSIKEKLISNKESAYLSQDLVRLVSDLDFNIQLEDLKLKQLQKVELSETLTELNFKGFEKTLLNDNKEIQETSILKNEKRIKSSVSISLEGLSESNPTLEELKTIIKPYDVVTVLKSGRGIYLYNGKELFHLPSDKSVGGILSEKHLEWHGCDIKSIWRDLEITRPVVPKMDLLLAAYVALSITINDLEQVYEYFTGKKIPDLPDGKILLECYLEVEPIILERLKEVDGEKVLNQIELPLVPVLYEMEKNGIGIDVLELKKQSEWIHGEVSRIEKEIHNLAGQDFNISSPKQLAQVLFEKLKLPSLKKTKTGFSTNADVLEKLASQHPICEKIIEYRENVKLISTYVDVLPKLVNPHTGRIHTTFKQSVTTTGRLSSVNPNLQNIPIRTEQGRRVRSAFVAGKNSVLLSIDYSQIELRILAHMTLDPGLIKAFNEDLDIHAATASEIFSVPLNQVDSELRRKAKAVNFGIAYGQGVFGLAETLNISRSEAKDIIDNYFIKFKNVKNFMDETILNAQKHGYVITLFGRKRFLKDIGSKNQTLKKFAERAAINAPMQGTASDLMKKAMIDIHQNVSCKLLLQVHDELLFEVEEDLVEEKSQELKVILENVYPLKVPLKVNIAWGKNWEDAHA